MNKYPSIVLSLSFIVQGLMSLATSVEARVVADPHKYFKQKTREVADKADSISLEAVPYAASYPTIDIRSWVDPASYTDDERSEVVHQILGQAIGAGSFNIKGHDVSVKLLDRLEAATEEFFSRSLDFKRQFFSEALAGYTPNQHEKYGSMIYKTENPLERKGDLREIFGVTYPPEFPDNVQGPEYFQSALNEYMKQLQPVESALMKIFSAALSLVKGVDLPLTFLHEADGGAPGYLRTHRYPAMPSEYDNATKFLPHSDFGTLTIIYGRENGLEEIRNGKWVEVPADGGALHVTVGQVLNMWSNGIFTSNIHRVSNRAAKDRISFAYFLAQGLQPAPINGTEPIFDPETEQPKFRPTSTGIHLGRYIEAMVDEKAI